MSGIGGQTLHEVRYHKPQLQGKVDNFLVGEDHVGMFATEGNEKPDYTCSKRHPDVVGLTIRPSEKSPWGFLQRGADIWENLQILGRI
jgi:hypothetical protein